jgi:hypothetical protein
MSSSARRLRRPYPYYTLAGRHGSTRSGMGENTRFGSKPVKLRTNKCFPVCPQKRTFSYGCTLYEYTPLGPFPAAATRARQQVLEDHPGRRRPASIVVSFALGDGDVADRAPGPCRAWHALVGPQAPEPPCGGACRWGLGHQVPSRNASWASPATVATMSGTVGRLCYP